MCACAPFFCIRHVQMTSLCVEVWRGSICVLRQRLIQVCDHLKPISDLYETEIGPRVTGRESGSPGSSKELNRDVESTLTVMASTNGQPGTWKDVDASDPVILVTEFGCRYLKFHLGTKDVSPAKKPCVELSAFDVMQSAAHQYRLPTRQPDTGNEKEHLYNDVFDYLEVGGIKFALLRLLY